MTCIIVDDEPLAREEMQSLIQEVSEVKILGCFSNAVAALEFIAVNTVDLIFLDIQMPRVTGLEFAEKIPKNILIIFTTAYPQYALKSYELDAIDYLLKPMDKFRLEKAINKAIVYKKLLSDSDEQTSFEKSTETFLIIKSDRRFYKIDFVDIRFIEGLKDYVVIYTKNLKLITAMNLKNIHQKITSDIFLRVSKSYVVNMNAITSFDNHTIYVDEFEIPLGEVYKNEFLKKYLKGVLPSDKH